MLLELRTLREKRYFFLNIDESHTIESVKALYAKKSGYSINILRLCNNGIALENTRTIKSYNLHENSIIHVVTTRIRRVRINPIKLKF